MGIGDNVGEDQTPVGAQQSPTNVRIALTAALVTVVVLPLGVLFGTVYSNGHVTVPLEHVLMRQKDHRITDERVFPLHKLAQPWSSVDFEKYTKIIVSGPQRSGTTYFTKALAEYLGYTHIDEFDGGKDIAYGNGTIKVSASDNPFAISDLSDLSIIKTTESYVAQRPQWSSILHLLPSKEELLIIFMARNCLDVFESQNKIMSEPGNTGWTCKFGRQMEWEKYNESDLRECVDLRDLICSIKQQAMKNCQMQIMEKHGSNLVILEYASLQTFKDYVDPSVRMKFGPKQTSA
jgi:hypothetical protein